MTTDETQGLDSSGRKVEAADEEPIPRTDEGAQWTANQLAGRYNLCMEVNGAENLTPFTWPEIMMYDGYGREGIELRCLDDVHQYPEKFGPNTKVDKKRVKSTLKKSKDPRGQFIEASKAKIDAHLNPPADADEQSDVTDDDSLVEPVLVVELEPQGDGEDLDADEQLDDDDSDDLGVGEYLGELTGRDWSEIDPWLRERLQQFREKDFSPKEPNDAVSALRTEISDLELEFARLVLFELAAPNDQLFPDHTAKLRQTFVLEELLKHDERYLQIISSGEQSDVDNLSFRTGQAARALTYGNRRLSIDDVDEGRAEQLPVISFVDEHRGIEAPADTSNSEEPEENPPTTPDEHVEDDVVVVIQPPAPEPVVSIAEPEPPEVPEAEDVPELDLVQVDLSDTSNSDQSEETPPTTSDAPEPAIDVAIVTVTDVQPPAPEPVVSINDVSSEPEQPEAPEAEDVPELEDVVDDDSDILAELDGLLTSGRERVTEMAEMGFTA